MKPRQPYLVIITESGGRRLRRLRLHRRSLGLVASALSLTLCCTAVMVVHSCTLLGQNAAIRTLRHSNHELRRLVHDLEGDLSQAQKLSRVVESTFEQLWVKSSLGVDPALLSVQADDEAETMETPREHPATQQLRKEGELRDGAIRICRQSVYLQNVLGETMEYFHDAQLRLANTPSIRPTRSPWLSSSFGKRRDPIFHYWVMHKGLDMAGAMGMEIMAPADGAVIWVGWRGGYGQTVVIDHGYGLQTHFAHLSKYLVSPGDRVRRGDLVAEMGSTGKSTGPHLHYEVRRFGQPLDPRRFILD